MAASNHIECHPVVGHLSNKSSSEMLAQSPCPPASRPYATLGIRAIIPTILNALIATQKRYQERNALNKLSDDQLRDIGLERTRDGYMPFDWH
ncbi:DUF1127 domain-containing protein [Thalassospira sp. HF15]|uniref:DUF1127 domain-containing protein n=1 Tax=Thalassospira sp. HF15 TaxID=2722755 RepID=UPI001431E73C|nr:DUF1127 domain-containing protein [Thalassospira sp. HF15]NIY76182.1 DUF1127 domain-containing protein [Thalassospira sp. HF15]